jgi:hypothetical protein
MKTFDAKDVEGIDPRTLVNRELVKAAEAAHRKEYGLD